MNQSNEVEITSTKSTVTQKLQDLRAVEALYNAAALQADVVPCAMIRPKAPPYLAD